MRALKTMLPMRHPNLIPLYGAGRTGKYCWVAMEYVVGENLTEVIGRIVFGGMLNGIRTLAEATSRVEKAGSPTPAPASGQGISH